MATEWVRSLRAHIYTSRSSRLVQERRVGLKKTPCNPSRLRLTCPTSSRSPGASATSVRSMWSSLSPLDLKNIDAVQFLHVQANPSGPAIPSVTRMDTEDLTVFHGGIALNTSCMNNASFVLAPTSFSAIPTSTLYLGSPLLMRSTQRTNVALIPLAIIVCLGTLSYNLIDTLFVICCSSSSCQLHWDQHTCDVVAVLLNICPVILHCPASLKSRYNSLISPSSNTSSFLVPPRSFWFRRRRTHYHRCDADSS